MGLTKTDKAERGAFLAELSRKGCSLSEAMREYDAKFGTHYSQFTPTEAKET